MTKNFARYGILILVVIHLIIVGQLFFGNNYLPTKNFHLFNASSVFKIEEIIHSNQSIGIQSPNAAGDSDTKEIFNSTQSQSFESTQSMESETKNSFLGFDMIFVINLKKRTDRLSRFEKIAKFLGFKYEVVPAFQNNFEELKAKFPWMTEDKHYNGVTASHFAAVSKIVDRNLTNALILEDDVDLDIDTPKKLPTFLNLAPDNWDILALYWDHSHYKFKRPMKAVGAIYQITKIRGAVAYAVSNRAAKIILEEAKKNDRAWDMILRDLIRGRAKTKKRLQAYSTWPILADHIGSTINDPSDNEIRDPEFYKDKVYRTRLRKSAFNFLTKVGNRSD